MTRLHIDSTFDEDLERIRESMLGMGGRVEEAITLAARALEERDEDLAQQVVEGDHAIDALEEEIDTQVVRLLALRQPQAGDLRAVIAVMKMAADIERLGDYAKNMAKRVPVLASGTQVEGASAAIRRPRSGRTASAPVVAWASGRSGSRTEPRSWTRPASRASS